MNNGFAQGSNGLMGSKRPLPSKSSYSISAGNSARGERQASTIMLQDQVDESMQLKAGMYATVQFSAVQFIFSYYSLILRRTNSLSPIDCLTFIDLFSFID